LSFFERAWASRRTEISVFDVIPILELVRAQPFNKVYPSDLHVIWDLAHAVRRSIHAYDVVNIIDYALISRVPAVHAYDVVPTYDWAYVARRNIVHAYDVIPQPDVATRSGNVTLSVTDILSVLEWFFRVNRALKVLEPYIPYELAVASAVPAIYAEDLSIIYDLGASINAIKTASAFDKLVVDYATYTKSYSPLFFSLFQRRVPIVYKTLSVMDTIAVSERIDYTKSYNTLFFSLLRRRVPIRYITLSVLDGFGVADYASIKKVVVVAVSDYAVADSASAKGVVAVPVSDYGLLADAYDLRNRAIAVYDIIPVADYGTAVRAVLLEAKDYMLASDYIDAKKVPAITASDVLLADSISTAKSYSPLLFAVLRRRVPIVYKALGILDTAIIKDTASAVLIKKVSVGDSLLADSYSIRNLAVHASDIATVADYGTAVKAKVLEALDYISAADNVYSNRAVAVTALDKPITDYVTYTKSYSPLFFTLLRRRVPIVYKTLSVLDVVAVKDSLSTVVVKTVPAYDYIGFDSVTYTKSYSPLFFTLLRRRVPIVYKTLSVLDVVAVKDGVSVIPIKVVSVLDVVPVADSVDVKSIAISVSDFIMYDYVPGMSPSDIRYRSLYANVGMRTISVYDRITPHESVWVGPRVVTVNARDYLVSDSAVVVKRSVHAYDVIVMWENVNIVRL